MRVLPVLTATCCLALVIGATAATVPGTSSDVELIGKNALYNRGMNAALAIYHDTLYVGNRTDGSDTCADGTTGCPHVHPGILILDIENPSNPTIVGEIPAPNGGLGVTTRELRVWPKQNLLIEMEFRCSHVIHACPAGNDTTFPFALKFYDIKGNKARNPQLLSTYVPTSAAGRKMKPHEMFLWIDPKNSDRALLYVSTPALSLNPAVPNLMVVDISAARQGIVTEVAEGNWDQLYPGATTLPLLTFFTDYNFNLFVHSMSVSPDGTRTYMALEAGHFLVLDTSSVASNVSPGTVISLNDKLITQPTDRPVWLQTPNDPTAVPVPCTKDCANSHSALKVFGRPLALSTDEVYGTFTDPSFGCRWGWMRTIDISDEAHPSIVGEYMIDENQPSFCGSAGDDSLTEQFTSYSSHNPTVLRNLAVIAWHSGGLQIVDLSDPTNPVQGGFFSPTPLASVAIEDPALSRGHNEVVIWSYPIIKDGLIYVVDIRNGLYVLRYTGPHADEIGGIDFLEGNSTLGDAQHLDNPED